MLRLAWKVDGIMPHLSVTMHKHIQRQIHRGREQTIARSLEEERMQRILTTPNRDNGNSSTITLYIT